jgi:hypothetical protein
MKLTLLIFHLLLYIASGKSYNVADMSKFGNCTILIKRFQDDTISADITSTVTMAQLSRKLYSKFSVYSSNNTVKIIQPIPSVREECTLNVIIGFVSENYLALYNYMMYNRYTFTSNKHSIYIIVLDSNDGPLALYPHTMALPTSVFTLTIPKESYNQNMLNSNPVYKYVCFFCKSTLRPVEYNKDIRLINDDWFHQNWKTYNPVIAVVNNARSGDITMCELDLWNKWLLPKDDIESDLSNLCTKPDAFWDLIIRSVNPNLTTHITVTADGSMYGFSGYLFQNLLTSDWTTSPWKAPTSHYHASAGTCLMYCDCDRRSNRISYDTWTTCFSETVWFCLIGAVSFAAVMKSFKLCLTSGKFALQSFLLKLTDIIGITIRQGSLNGTGLAVFSLGMFVISALFENMLMSTLVVPNKLAVFDLATLAHSNYEVQILCGSDDDFNTSLGFLNQELIASKVTVAYSRLQPYKADEWDSPEAFINNRFSIFLIALSITKDFLKQKLKSLTPNHCTCSEVRNLRLKFSVFSMIWHRLRYRIFHNLEVAKAAGLDLFLDWNLERNEVDSFVLKKQAKSGKAIFDSFVSLKNLVPMLEGLGCLVTLCCFIFLFELRKSIPSVISLKLHRICHWQEFFSLRKIRFKGIKSLKGNY